MGLVDYTSYFTLGRVTVDPTNMSLVDKVRQEIFIYKFTGSDHFDSTDKVEQSIPTGKSRLKDTILHSFSPPRGTHRLFYPFPFLSFLSPSLPFSRTESPPPFLETSNFFLSGRHHCDLVSKSPAE